MTEPQVVCQLQMGNMDGLYDQILANAPHAQKHLIQRDSHKGKTVIICGAGPSLKDQHDFLWNTPSHQIWGCNSALNYLKDHNLPVSHGFCVDQNPDMLKPAEWERTFDVTYLLATSVYPGLREHLQQAKRKIVWFHNYLGVPDPEGWVAPPSWKCDSTRTYEMFLYTTKFPPSVQVGYGLNSVPRAICLAIWMGFKKIHVVGADCACAPDFAPMPVTSAPEYPEWVNSIPLYATGRTVGESYGDQAVMVEGMINGHRWTTRTDMLISAIHMVDLARSYPDKVHLVGDTLPNAMLPMPKEFFETLPKMAGKGQITGFAMHKDLLAHLDTVTEEVA